jgi:hypothetical protein
VQSSPSHGPAGSALVIFPPMICETNETDLAEYTMTIKNPAAIISTAKEALRALRLFKYDWRITSTGTLYVRDVANQRMSPLCGDNEVRAL